MISRCEPLVNTHCCDIDRRTSELSLQEPPPDFVHTEFFLSPYIKILGARTLSLATFARCHCTQGLFRMKWEWAPRDPELMGPIGNWETADGKRFFC